METKKSMSVAARGKSMIHAVNGIRETMKEPNAILHAIATVLVIIAGFARHIDTTRWIAILFAIGFVWLAEILNTCIEKLSDYSCANQQHPAIKAIKDMAAGAVLVAAITSFVIGIIVFFF